LKFRKEVENIHTKKKKKKRKKKKRKRKEKKRKKLKGIKIPIKCISHIPETKLPNASLNGQRKKQKTELQNAVAGDRTRVTRVTGGNTYHYTTTTLLLSKFANIK
jgi:hypothetical protein